MNIHVVITGRSYHTAEQLPRQFQLPESATVADALAAVSRELPQGEQLPASCLVALSGDHLGTVSSHQNRPLREGDELTLISPVAGG